MFIVGEFITAASFTFNNFNSLIGPRFFPPLYEKPLGKNDANFVDTIHSDVFFIGTKFPLGHVTFFPNYNKTQPGCPKFKLESFFDFLNSKKRTKNFQFML